MPRFYSFFATVHRVQIYRAFHMRHRVTGTHSIARFKFCSAQPANSIHRWSQDCPGPSEPLRFPSQPPHPCSGQKQSREEDATSLSATPALRTRRVAVPAVPLRSESHRGHSVPTCTPLRGNPVHGSIFGIDSSAKRDHPNRHPRFPGIPCDVFSARMLARRATNRNS